MIDERTGTFENGQKESRTFRNEGMNELRSEMYVKFLNFHSKRLKYDHFMNLEFIYHITQNSALKFIWTCSFLLESEVYSEIVSDVSLPVKACTIKNSLFYTVTTFLTEFKKMA